jgi:hypothetical protein
MEKNVPLTIKKEVRSQRRVSLLPVLLSVSALVIASLGCAGSLPAQTQVPQQSNIIPSPTPFLPVPNVTLLPEEVPTVSSAPIFLITPDAQEETPMPTDIVVIPPVEQVNQEPTLSCQRVVADPQAQDPWQDALDKCTTMLQEVGAALPTLLGSEIPEDRKMARCVKLQNEPNHCRVTSSAGAPVLACGETISQQGLTTLMITHEWGHKIPQLAGYSAPKQDFMIEVEASKLFPYAADNQADMSMGHVNQCGGSGYFFYDTLMHPRTGLDIYNALVGQGATGQQFDAWFENGTLIPNSDGRTFDDMAGAIIGINNASWMDLFGRDERDYEANQHLFAANPQLIVYPIDSIIPQYVPGTLLQP